MLAFRIHEDKENVRPAANKPDESNDAKLNCNANRESRKVLQHVTNVRQNFVAPTRCALAPKNCNKIVTCFDGVQNRTSPKVEYDDVLDRACSLVCSQLTVVTPVTSRLKYDVGSDMSVDSLHTHTNDCSDTHESRLNELLYTEPQYRKHVYAYLLEAENHHRPFPQYMKKQSELNDEMRRILIDWLVSISDEYEFAPITLHLAVSYIDRFLSKMSVVRTKFQLLGVTAMMVAAKYEEVYPPDIHEFSSLTKDTCSVKQILKMEELLLRVLSFDLTTPTVQTFIEEYTVLGSLSEELMNMTMFISELCLVESVNYVSYLPSQIAASSLVLSRHTMNEDNIWPKKLENISNYNLNSLYPIVKLQHKVLQDSPNKSLQAVRLKYSKDTYKNVTRFTPRELE